MIERLGLVNVHRFLEEFFDVVHCDEGCGRGGDHDDWEIVAFEEERKKIS
jgi:hypothetical protein